MNAIADAFLEEINKGLAEYILPDKFDSTFSTFFPHDAPLYVSRRRWCMGDEKPGDEFAYEECFHRQYWPAFGNDRPVLIVTGGEGVGKSTFIQYYFCCYLPNFYSFPYGGGNQEDHANWRRECSRHVVLYVDLRRAPGKEAVERTITSAFARQIRTLFPNLTIENDFAMWQRIARWDDPIHSEAERGLPDRRAYRAGFVAPFLALPAHRFVEEAIWYLAAQRNEHGERTYYVTLVFDNLDQQDRETQHHAIQIVLSWLGERLYYSTRPSSSVADEGHLGIWKAVLPLRRETLLSLSSVLEPVERKVIIQLGEVDESRLLARRGEWLQSLVRATGKQVERDYLIEEDQTRVYVPLSNVEASLRVRRQLTYVLEEQVEGAPSNLLASPRTARLVEQFCNGSIRRFLRLRKRVAMSRSIEEALKASVRHQRTYRPILSDYLFLNGWITGPRDHYDRHDPDNDLLNLYDTTRQEPSPYALLIGPHLLYLLRRRRSRVDELAGLLTNIGYTEPEVQDCLEALHERGLFRFADLGSPADRSIEIETNIIEAHEEFLTSPAYIDNMAMVTPVEGSLGAEMRLTVGYDPRDFVARARTTCSFLQQIYHDELAVSTWARQSPRHRADADEFTKTFNSLGLPSVYRKAAVRYRRRIEALRGQFRLGPLAGADTWSSLLGKEVLRVDDEEANAPLRARLL